MVQIKFDWSVQLANGYRDPETHIQWKSLLPGHTCQTLFSWFRAQNMVQCPISLPISLPFARRWKNNSSDWMSSGSPMSGSPIACQESCSGTRCKIEQNQIFVRSAPSFRSLIAATNASAFFRFSFFLALALSFVRPRRRLSSAPTVDFARRRAQKLSRSAVAPP